VAAGLPAAPPAIGDGDVDGFPWVFVGALVAFVMGGLVAVGVAGTRRRPATAS
jgi:hypothetical protein